MTVIDLSRARTLRHIAETKAIIRKQKLSTDRKRVRLDARLAAFLDGLTDARDNAPIPDRPCDVSVEAGE